MKTTRLTRIACSSVLPLLGLRTDPPLPSTPNLDHHSSFGFHHMGDPSPRFKALFWTCGTPNIIMYNFRFPFSLSRLLIHLQSFLADNRNSISGDHSFIQPSLSLFSLLHCFRHSNSQAPASSTYVIQALLSTQNLLFPTTVKNGSSHQALIVPL